MTVLLMLETKNQPALMSQMKCLQVDLQVQTKLYWLPSSDAYNSTWLIYIHSLSQWMDDERRPVI